ncbi:MAG: hypothetical protein Q4P16_02810 [Spirochaetales bacterium]|nr:hypothetical protein [Spirochaetales bacterium]
MSQEYLALQERKRKWIPLACIGKCSISQASKRIGITPNSVSVLKRRYRLYGDSIFVNGHKGKSYQKKKYSDELRKKIIWLYLEYWNDCNFATFKDRLKEYHKIKIGIITLTKILNKAGIKSPKAHSKGKKKKHLPRKERPCTGELLQLDASEHDWLMNGEKNNTSRGCR